MLYSEPLVVSDKDSLKRKVEEIIHDLPRRINDSRDATQLSNVDEAMEVFISKGLLAHEYDLREMITDQLPANEVHKATLLKKAVLNLTEKNPSVAVYTCTPICNTVGFVNNTFVLVDTHRISSELGGNEKALIKFVRCEDTTESKEAGASAAVDWLERRMASVVGDKRGSESLLHLVINGSSSREPAEVTLSDDELLASLTPTLQDYPENHGIGFPETFGPIEHASQVENLHPRENDQEMSEETTSQVQRSCNNHDAQDKQQSGMQSDSPLWQHPSFDRTDEMTELLWKGHLTKFYLSSLKQFQLDAIRSIEKKKKCHCSAKNR